MLIAALICFLIAASLGLYLSSFVLLNKETPKGVAFIHGPVAALGLILLLIYAFLYNPSPWFSIIVFIFAAMGGAILIYRDLFGKTIPTWMAIGHGAVALVGLILLIKFIFF